MAEAWGESGWKVENEGHETGETAKGKRIVGAVVTYSNPLGSLIRRSSFSRLCP